jgi:ArsR family transcriptional regulator, arsenate/arsenite/antimonite-responsive transcriptional repressor
MKKMNLVYKALADPTRRDILNLLRNRDLTAGEIADHFRISKPSISHHLNLLKQADLVHAEKEGQYIHYSINTTVLQDVLTWLLSLQEGKGKKE